MKLRQSFFAAATFFGFAAGIFPAAAQANRAVTTAPVYVPDLSHAGQPLPDGLLAWDALLKTVDATNGQDFAHFTFSFTNLAKKFDLGLATNVISTTNSTTVTNAGFWARLFGNKISQAARIARSTNTVVVTNSITPLPVTVLNVHPSCGCTTAELPPVPWLIPAGANGQIKLSVNLQGKAGTLFKSVVVTTDKGMKTLMLRINILPEPPMPAMTEAQRDAGIAAAKVDRQAVFKGDCASCHVKKIEGKYGQQLFAALCVVCHEAQNRATMVPDLHNLKVPTNEEFWRTWMTFGKPGTLMPAFATAQGGVLNDMQIASLAAYLNAVIPSHVPPPAAR
jgi:mono/diheme cytochrome c family protein